MLSKVERIPEWLAGAENENKGTLWQVVNAYRANLRQGTVGVKTRSMVRSTGKKPFEQKKTGNARRGSFVSPLHVGGGVAHGPKARDYRQNTPEKMKTVALKIALAKKIEAGTVFSGELAVNSGKTKDAATLLSSIVGKARVGKVVVCMAQPDEASLRAFRNIRGMVLRSPAQVTALDLVQSRHFVVSSEALAKLQQRLSV